MNQNFIQRAIARVIPLVVKSGLYNNLATFQSADADDWPDGFYSGNYQDLPGLALLPCIAASSSGEFIQTNEAKSLQDITASQFLHVSFTAYYLSLESGWRSGWRVVIGTNDGSGNMINPVSYDLLGAGVDSQNQHSVCDVRLTTI